MEKETPSKKAAAPSVSQINAEYVTQVIIVHVYYTCGSVTCWKKVFPCRFYAEDRNIVPSSAVSLAHLHVISLLSELELYLHRRFTNVR